MIASDDWKPTEDDLPNAYPHWSAVEATCGHVIEYRCVKPLEPKLLIPQANDTCGWCDADAMNVPKDAQPIEVRNPHFGGLLIRKCPLTMAEIREWNEIEERVMADGPPR